MKDRPQKKLALKYCAAQRIIPFLEVLVRSQTGLEDVPFNITDIDVMAVDIERSGAVRRLLFDCKSASRLSPINRSIWAAGLKAFVQADSAYVIQLRDVPYSHQLAANTLDVHVHTEDSFRRYANSISIDFSKDITYLDDIDIWDSLLRLEQTQPVLLDLSWFTSNQASLEHSAARGVRLGLSALLKSGPELDPRKPLHRTLFGNLVSALLIFLSSAAASIKEVFQFSMQKTEFERTMRYFIWEGRENYEIRRDMKSAIDEARGARSNDLDLPEWNLFLEMMRSFLDAPEAVTSLPFLSKELAFRASAARRKDADDHIRSLFAANNRARQFLFSTARYLVHAGKLPLEFSSLLESDINGLLTAAPANDAGASGSTLKG